MIQWNKLENKVSKSMQRRWRKVMCEAILHGKTCMGYAISEVDDEPCEICKMCDRLDVEEGG